MYKKCAPQLWLLLCIVAVYAQTLTFDFINLDDPVHLHLNPYLNAQAPIWELWKLPYKRLYIPLTYSVWALFYTNPPESWLFHGLNLLLHAATSAFLVFPLLRRIGGTLPALAGGILFALHPLQIEAVSWISGLKDVLSGSLLFLSLTFFLKADGSKPERTSLYLSAATFVCILAALAKPSAVMFPVLALLLVGTPSKRQLQTILLCTLMLIPIVLLTWSAQSADGFLFTPPPLWQRPLVALDALGFYLWKLFVPIHLSLDYGRTPDALLRHSLSWILLAVPLFFGLALLAHAKYTKTRFSLTGGLFFLIALVPVLGLKPFVYQTTSTVADRYLYVSFFGVSLVLTNVLRFFPKHATRVGIAVLLVLLGPLCFSQVRVWKNSFTIFNHVTALNPRSWLAYNNLASAYEKAGDFTNALTFYEKSISIRPHVPGFNSLGILQMQLGHPDKAIEWLQKGVSMGLEDARLYNNLGTAWLQIGERKKAEIAFLRAMEIQPMSITQQNLQRLYREPRG